MLPKSSSKKKNVKVARDNFCYIPNKKSSQKIELFLLRLYFITIKKMRFPQ